MELIGALFLICLGAMAGAAAAWQRHLVSRSEREVTLDAEVKALRSAQRLSLASWRARNQMQRSLHDDDPFDPTF